MNVSHQIWNLLMTFFRKLRDDIDSIDINKKVVVIDLFWDARFISLCFRWQSTETLLLIIMKELAYLTRTLHPHADYYWINFRLSYLIWEELIMQHLSPLSLNKMMWRKYLHSWKQSVVWVLMEMETMWWRKLNLVCPGVSVYH